MKYKTIKYSTTICTFTVDDATSRTSEYLSQQLNARQNEPPLNILQTPNLGTVVQMAAGKVLAKKTLPRNIPTHAAKNNMQRTQHARRPHTNKTVQCTQYLLLFLVVNSAKLHSTWFKYCITSSIKELQYYSKIIKYYHKQVICVWQKYCKDSCISRTCVSAAPQICQ